ncbi:MAG: hypothetical protein JW965_00690 [Bacteroidales bacterium]|nr:hypothetical protein [Bacteroidales bacterium]
MSDLLTSIFVYNISILEYFQFRFFEKDKDERKKWAGTGYLYEYQLKMNPRVARIYLEDKIEFLKYFRLFIKRGYADIQTLKSDRDCCSELLANKTGKLVLKGSHGQVGAEVEVILCKDYSPESLINYMLSKKYDLAEEYVQQHQAMMALSPSGLNTVRVLTQLNEGNVDFLGARLRISVNSPVDNMAAGNLAAFIEMETGIVKGPGVYSDITKEDMIAHPVTGKAISGFNIPFWDEVIALTRKAAIYLPENRSVGWDIAITEEGPELIEGNHNWCKLLWQLPAREGLKHELEKYL